MQKQTVRYLYLETGALTSSFILSSKRLNYLHTILNRNKRELVGRVYCDQRDNPFPGDFMKLIKKDFVMIEEKFIKTEHKQMSKEPYRYTYT